MSINGIENVLTGTAQTTVPLSSDISSKDTFLTLLVAQLQHQDPLNPMDETQFTSQLAQFSSLEEMQNVNTNLKSLQGIQKALFDENVVSFIGKTAKYQDNTINLTEGTSPEIDFSLAGAAKTVYLNIYDSNGNFIKEIIDDNQGQAFSGGEHSTIWDGTDHEGLPVPSGRYTFEASAVNANDDMIDISSFTKMPVTGVSFYNGMTYLLSGGDEIGLDKVIEVTNNN